MIGHHILTSAPRLGSGQCERHTHRGREGGMVCACPHVSLHNFWLHISTQPPVIIFLSASAWTSARGQPGALNTDSSRITGSPSHTHGTAHKHTPPPTLPALYPHFNPKSPLRSIKKFQVAKLRRRGRVWRPPLPIGWGITPARGRVSSRDS